MNKKDCQKHKLTMSISGKEPIDSEKVRDMFLKLLNDRISVERIGVYFNRRKEIYSIDVNLWQIACLFSFETMDCGEYRIIHDQLTACNKLLNEYECGEFYQDLLSCYADVHKRESSGVERDQ